MRKLEETINRSGLWRADVPHFIGKDRVEAIRAVAGQSLLARLW
jgi:hypothetical protein